MVGIVPTAASSPPDPSSGCKAQPRFPAGDYTHADWPITQTGAGRPSIQRTFKVHVPRQHGEPQGAPLPIVINLHGSASTGADQDRVSGMRELADAKGFVVATPDAWPWAAWEASRDGFGDVDFIKDLLDIMADKLCVDGNRIFATGLSSGGLMSVDLARASAAGSLGRHRIAAIAPVAAFPLPAEWRFPRARNAAASNGEEPFSAYVPRPAEDILKFCHRLDEEGPREAPVPIHVFFANQDRLVANGACYGTYSREVSRQPEPKRTASRAFFCSCYNSAEECPEQTGVPKHPGIRGNVGSLVASAWCLVNRWAEENGCSESPLPSVPPIEGSSGGWGVPVSRRTWDCSAVANSRGDTILTIFDTTESLPQHLNNIEYPSGHIWPGGAGDGVDEVHASSFKVTEAIWKFFEDHPR
jgi:poly(3-hydroxybutyrate) depolymerase